MSMLGRRRGIRSTIERNLPAHARRVAIACLDPLESRQFLSASFRGLGGLVSETSAGYIPISQALAISADGSTVYGSVEPAPGDASGFNLFRWTRSEGLTRPPGVAPRFPDMSAGFGGFNVQDVSADGAVAVGTVGNGSSGGGAERSGAFRWSGRDGLTVFTPLAASLGDGVSSEAWGTSADGAVAAGTRWDVAPGESVLPDTPRAFRWTDDNGIQDLPGLPAASPAVI